MALRGLKARGTEHKNFCTIQALKENVTSLNYNKVLDYGSQAAAMGPSKSSQEQLSFWRRCFCGRSGRNFFFTQRATTKYQVELVYSQAFKQRKMAVNDATADILGLLNYLNIKKAEKARGSADALVLTYSSKDDARRAHMHLETYINCDDGGGEPFPSTSIDINV